MKNICQRVAEIYGVSEKEVKEEIENALSASKESRAPEAQAFWQNAPQNTDQAIAALADLCIRHIRPQ